MTPMNSSSAQKDNQTKDAGVSLERSSKGKSLMGILRKSAFEKKKTPSVEQQTPPSPLVQRRHSTSTDESNYFSRGGDSMVPGTRERKRFDRSRSLDGYEGHRELKKQHQPRSKSDNITKTQRVVNMPSVADDEDDESTETGWNLEWILGHEWIQGIVAAIEGLPFLPGSKEKGPGDSDEWGPNDTSALGYRVASSGTLQFRKIRHRG